MLGVGLKKMEATNIAGPLRAYITSNHSAAEAAKLDATLALIDRNRTTLSQSFDRHDSDMSIEALLNYYYLLIHLEQHFPFGSENQPSVLGFRTGKVPVVKVPWSWYDSYRTTKKVLDFDINFEKACAMFNLAALYSREATREKRASEDGLKAACRSFQIAAGVFDYLAADKKMAACGILSMDISTDSLTMLSRLMVAQAQACFFEKAATTAVSADLIAKIAMGAAELFQQCATLADNHVGGIKQWLTKATYPWHTHFMYQHYCFSAAAFYWRAKHLIKGENYGEEIAHLERAKTLIEKAKKVAVPALAALTENGNALDKIINARLVAANKDNDHIFFAPIPKLVEEVERKMVVAAIPFELKMDGREDPFAKLVAPEVQEAAAQFASKVSEVVASARRGAQESTDYSKMHLSSLNLPAALEAMEPATGLPEEVWSHVQETQFKGGVTAMTSLFTQLMSGVTETEQVFASVKDALMKEREDDLAMRRQFGHRWNRRPSEQITVSFQKDIEQIEKYIADAAASNNKIRIEWRNNQDKLASLEMTRDQIEAKLPHVTRGAGKNEAAVRLGAMVSELSSMVARRERLVEELTNESKRVSDGAVTALAAGQKTRTFEQTMAELMVQLAPPQAALNQLASEEKALQDAISAQNEVFVKTRSRTEDMVLRENVIQGLNVAVNTYNKLISNINEGLKFYGDLARQKLEPLKQRLTDFAVARDIEKRMILDQLTAELAGYPGDSKQSNTATSSGGYASIVPSAPGGPSYGAPSYAAPSASAPQWSIPTSASLTAANPNLSYEQPATPMYAFTGTPPTPAAPQPTSSVASPMIAHATPVAMATPVPNATHNSWAPPQSNAYAPQPAPAYSSYPSATAIATAVPVPVTAAPSVAVAAPPPATAPAASPTGEWSCPACTYGNKKDDAKCAMCAGDKPKVVAAAPAKTGFFKKFFT